MAQENLTKCPACGALRTSFSAFCSDCGYEFNDIQSSQSLKEFTDKIENYDREIEKNNTESTGASVGTFLLWMFFFPYMLCYYIFKKMMVRNGKLSGIEKLKAEAITNYPVPNSRNDLMEYTFLIENHVKPIGFLASLSKSGKNTQQWNKVWLNKGQSLYRKASIALSGDKSSLQHIQQSIDNMQNIYSQNKKNQWIAIGILGAIFILIIVLASL